MSEFSQMSDEVNSISNKQSVSLARSAYAHPFRVFHLLFLMLFFLMLSTGLMVHAGAAPGWSFIGNSFPSWLPTGRWGMWHMLGGVVLLAVFLPGLMFYLYQSVHRRRPKKRAIWHWLLWITLGILCVSGLALVHDWWPARFYRVWRYVHLSCGVVLLPIVLVGHIWRGWSLGWRFWLRCFDPVSRPAKGIVLVMLIPGIAVGSFLVLGTTVSPKPDRVLNAPRVGSVPDDLWSYDWVSLPPLQIRLANGVGFSGGITTMNLRAFHDGESLYVRADWDDPAEQHNLYPWLRTADGWQRLDSANEHYEDKMALVFPIQPSWKFERLGCTSACHLGGGRDFGYKSSEVMLDVWHWKSARTQSVGQVDDKYWTTGDYQEKGPVGRKGDPTTGGGYTTNQSKDKTHPAFLPDPSEEASPPGVILKARALPYSPEAAAIIKEGTIIPGLVVEPFEGDRGDVSSLARFEDGQWHLIVHRKLNTATTYDVRFEPGEAYSFGTAAFDHTRWRHAYHYGTYKLALAP